MAATVSGGKTVNGSYSPKLTGAYLTTLMATAPENLTIQQVLDIVDALERIPGGMNVSVNGTSPTIGSLLT